MSKQAFDALLAELDEEERANIYAAAASFGLSFDDPSWVPFAITRITLADLKQEGSDIADAIEAAADRALSKIDTKTRAVSEQARSVIDAQAKALGNIHRALETLLAQGQERYRAELARLDAEHMSTLVDESASKISQNMSASLKDHVAELDRSRDRFSTAIDAVINRADNATYTATQSARRKLVSALCITLVAMGTCAGTAISTMLFMYHHETAAQTDFLHAYAAQRDELLKQVKGAKQLLTKQRTGELSLRYYGKDLYLLAPTGVGNAERCDYNGPLTWLQPGGIPCVPIQQAG